MNNLNRKDWENKDIQNDLEKERQSISVILYSKKIVHYTMKFTSYFAVKQKYDTINKGNI